MVIVADAIKVCHSYLTVMSPLSNGIEPVSSVGRGFPAQPADRLQVLQAKEGQLLPVLAACIGVTLRPAVCREGLAGPPQHHLIHRPKVNLGPLALRPARLPLWDASTPACKRADVATLSLKRRGRSPS